MIAAIIAALVVGAGAAGLGLARRARRRHRRVLSGDRVVRGALVARRESHAVAVADREVASAYDDGTAMLLAQAHVAALYEAPQHDHASQHDHAPQHDHTPACSYDGGAPVESCSVDAGSYDSSSSSDYSSSFDSSGSSGGFD